MKKRTHLLLAVLFTWFVFLGVLATTLYAQGIKIFHWSPDGTKIIFEGATKFLRELMVLRLATGEWESATVPNGPIFENSFRYGPRWK